MPALADVASSSASDKDSEAVKSTDKCSQKYDDSTGIKTVIKISLMLRETLWRVSSSPPLISQTIFTTVVMPVIVE